MKPPNIVRSKKVAQRERGSDEPEKTSKLPGGAKLRPKQFFVGWDPNRQNRSPTDEMRHWHTGVGAQEVRVLTFPDLSAHRRRAWEPDPAQRFPLNLPVGADIGGCVE